MREWARRLGPRGVVANAMHPGWADTPGLVGSLPGFARLVGRYLRTPTEGADTIVWLASAEEAGRVTGKLFLDRRPRPFDRVPMTRVSPETRRALWDRVEAMTGERPFASDDRRRRDRGRRPRTSILRDHLNAQSGNASGPRSARSWASPGASAAGSQE